MKTEKKTSHIHKSIELKAWNDHVTKISLHTFNIILIKKPITYFRKI